MRMSAVKLGLLATVLLAPAAGQRFLAHARVLKPGRTLTVCAAEVRAESAGGEKLVAAMQATMIGFPAGEMRAV